MLAPVDGSQLQEPELGGVRAQARGAALLLVLLLGNGGEGLGCEGGRRGLLLLAAGVRLRGGGGEGQKGGGPAEGVHGAELLGLLRELADLLWGEGGRHCVFLVLACEQKVCVGFLVVIVVAVVALDREMMMRDQRQ